jgi:hypothetical protein
VTIQLSVRAQGATDGGELHLDDLNGGAGDGALAAFPASCLTDDFDDGVRASQWNGGIADAGSSAQESGGELVIIPAFGSASWSAASYYTRNVYDLRGGALAVKVTESTQNGARTFLHLYTDGGDLTIDQQGTTLACTSGGTTLGSVTYAPATHVFWRFVEGGGTVRCEWSTDGVGYFPIGGMPTPAWVAAVHVGLFAGASNVAAPGRARFDDFNR